MFSRKSQSTQYLLLFESAEKQTKWMPLPSGTQFESPVESASKKQTNGPSEQLCVWLSNYRFLNLLYRIAIINI